jgi:hypothetical protein
MACIWHLTANCSTQEHAELFKKHFDHSTFSVPHAGLVELRMSGESVDSGWEVSVFPYVERPEKGKSHLNDHAGADTPEEAADIEACAKVFYERLGNALSFLVFQFALTGFEVSEFRSPGELLDDLSPSGSFRQLLADKSGSLNGLVISRHIYEAASEPPGFARFGPGYFWVPGTGV